MILPVNFKSNTHTNPKTSQKKIDKYLPLKAGLMSAGIWTGVGYATDYLVMKKLLKMNTNSKASNIINIVFGVAMGAGTYYNVWKKQKEEGISNMSELTENFVKNA